MHATRRKFLAALAGSPAVISFGARAPGFLTRAAASSSAGGNDAVLVVVQLSGGNDGLNTVIPYRDEAYYALRPKLAIPAADALKIDDRTAWHPSARGLADLLEAGKISVIQGVGYDHPNRSHFESMDIWHTCRRKGKSRSTGWLGRYVDASSARSDVDPLAIHIGDEKQPLALAAENVRAPSFATPETFRLRVDDNPQLRNDVASLLRSEGDPADPLMGFLQTSAMSALATSERIAEALRASRTSVVYPESALAARLQTIARLIDAELRTRVYYVELDGFDTHSQQSAAHAALLQQFAGAVRAFVDDVERQGHGARVLVMAFSEFGRRAAENASQGTDHGAAAPLFLAGSRVRAGLFGEHPKLDDLDDGDLKHHTDFRRVYATLLERWLGWPSADVLGGAFEPLEVVNA